MWRGQAAGGTHYPSCCLITASREPARKLLRRQLAAGAQGPHRARTLLALAAGSGCAGALLGLLVHGGDVLQQVAHAAAVAVLVVVPGHQLDLPGGQIGSSQRADDGEGVYAEIVAARSELRIACHSTCRPTAPAEQLRAASPLTKVGDREMPAPASTMEECVSPTKSVDTTASVVKLQPGWFRAEETLN